MRYALLAILLLPAVALGRTIELRDTDVKKMAVISSEMPRNGWVSSGSGGNYTNFYIELDTRGTVDRTILLKFPLDKIPEGMRVVSAELVLPVIHLYPADNKPRMHFRRIVGEWGAGVCHEYRMVRPKLVKWAAPGATAPGRDLARRVSAVQRVEETGDLLINVTDDVELWNSGAVPNEGWAITLDDRGSLVRFHSPTWSPNTWKLRVTFEPR